MGGGGKDKTTGEIFIDILNVLKKILKAIKDLTVGVAENVNLNKLIDLIKPLIPPIDIKHLPYFAERPLADGKHHTEDIKDDEEQGIGTSARAGSVMNLAGGAGTLILEIFDGNDWSKKIPLAVGIKFVFQYHDNIQAEKVKLTASGGAVAYRAIFAPGGN